MFRKFVVAALLSLVASAAFAGQTAIDTTGLTDAQVAELKAIAAQRVADTAKSASAPIAQNDVSTVTTLAATWGQQAATAAEGFAKALGIAAKELGVTINDFLHTDAGKLTALVIIWKVAGSTIIHLMYSGLVVTVGLTCARVLYVRLFTKDYEKVQYSRFFGMFHGEKLVRVPKTVGELTRDGEWFAFWVLGAVIFATLLFGGMML